MSTEQPRTSVKTYYGLRWKAGYSGARATCLVSVTSKQTAFDGPVPIEMAAEWQVIELIAHLRRVSEGGYL